MLRWSLRLLVAVLALGMVLLLLGALVTVPALLLGVDQLQVVRKIQDPSKQMDEVNGLRSTLAAVLAGLAVAAGAIVGALNFRETSRQNRNVLELQRRGQVTERFTRAIEQLGDDKITIRIGAVYALEQIARDSAELHRPVVEVLTTYLREHSRVTVVRDEADRLPLPADQQAIATVLGRRSNAQRPQLDLHGAYLVGVKLVRANLGWANLAEADLAEADLAEADLVGAKLVGAKLGGAKLGGAKLAGADLGGAHLVGANLARANLARANLIEADLRGANLGGAGRTWPGRIWLGRTWLVRA